jgi:phosphatidylinositol alpha 1,6-mannosyltransferase
MGIGAQVTFTGLVDYAALPAYFACSDVFVMTSINDTHPLTVLEAMGAGLPLIVVKSPAYADTVFDGLNGLVAQNTPQAMCEAMETLAVDADLRTAMGLRSREVAERFSVERTADQLIKLYTSVLQERPKA